ncbi:MAG: glycoside hydrolase family 3 protein, partial [Phyllobacterium sp.]
MKKIICNWLIVSLVPIVVSACDGDGKPEAAAPPAVPSASTFTQNDPGKAKPAVPVSDTKITAIVEPKGQELKPAIPPVDKPTPPGIAPVKEAAVPEIAPSAPIVDPADTRARKLVAQMTDDEKIGFTHTDAFVVAGVPGGGAAHIPGLARLGIPDLTMADSSIGAGSGQFPSTTFPATIGLAASWDGQLSYDYGVAIARQLRAQGFEMGLGGGANMVRDPRAGRLFEYLGEDPLLSGKLLAQRTKGTQSEKVIATIKHMVGNEQESWRGANPFDRVGISSIDERTLREIYMLPFEIAVEESEPGNVMCSYNKLRLEGDTQPLSACEHPHILTDILKHEWGFKGQVQSDWGATHSTAAAINAGLDEEEWAVPVPLPNFTPDKIKAALKDGSIKAERLNDMVQRKLRTMIKIGVMDDPAPDNSGLGFAPATDLKAGAALAQKVAEQSLVLLKNDGSQAPLKLPAAGTKLLPLDAGGLKRIAVIGGHADTAVLAGGGSGDTRVPSNGSFSS